MIFDGESYPFPKENEDYEEKPQNNSLWQRRQKQDSQGKLQE